MYKWFTLQFPSVETLYGLCQENMNIEHKRGRGWNNIRLSPGWHVDRAHSRNSAHWIARAAYHCHGPIPMSSLEVGQGWYWRGFFSHYRGDKEKQNNGISKWWNAAAHWRSWGLHIFLLLLCGSGSPISCGCPSVGTYLPPPCSTLDHTVHLHKSFMTWATPGFMDFAYI